ncbi:hypothetical protein IWX65_003571 [Arthrobacter sp. CAN_A214]
MRPNITCILHIWMTRTRRENSASDSIQRAGSWNSLFSALIAETNY